MNGEKITVGEGKLTGHHSNPGQKDAYPAFPLPCKKLVICTARLLGTHRNLPSTPASTYKAHLPLIAYSVLCAYKETKKTKGSKRETKLLSYCWHCPPALWHHREFYRSSCSALLFSFQHPSPGFFTLILCPTWEHNMFIHMTQCHGHLGCSKRRACSSTA